MWILVVALAAVAAVMIAAVIEVKGAKELGEPALLLALNGKAVA